MRWAGAPAGTPPRSQPRLDRRGEATTRRRTAAPSPGATECRPDMGEGAGEGGCGCGRERREGAEHRCARIPLEKPGWQPSAQSPTMPRFTGREPHARRRHAARRARGRRTEARRHREAGGPREADGHREADDGRSLGAPGLQRPGRRGIAEAAGGAPESDRGRRRRAPRGDLLLRRRRPGHLHLPARLPAPHARRRGELGAGRARLVAVARGAAVGPRPRRPPRRHRAPPRSEDALRGRRRRLERRPHVLRPPHAARPSRTSPSENVVEEESIVRETAPSSRGAPYTGGGSADPP